MKSFLETMTTPVLDIRPSSRHRPTLESTPPTIVRLCASGDPPRAICLLITGPLTRPQITGLHSLLDVDAIAFPSLAKHWGFSTVIALPDWAAAHCQEPSPPPHILTFILLP